MAASDNLSSEQFSTWYHGTTAENADKIRSGGLTAMRYGVGNFGNPSYATVTQDPNYASTIAKKRAEQLTPGKPGRVVELHVPADQESEYIVPERSRTGAAVSAGLHKPLPGGMVHDVLDAHTWRSVNNGG